MFTWSQGKQIPAVVHKTHVDGEPAYAIYYADLEAEASHRVVSTQSAVCGRHRTETCGPQQSGGFFTFIQSDPIIVVIRLQLTDFLGQ